MGKGKRKIRSYTNEFIESVLKRIDQNETVKSLSEELGVSKTTIYD